MVRPPSFDSNGMKKGAWSEEEDNKLRAYILRYGHWNWRLLPKYAGLARCGKSCRLRWVNYLKPGVKRGNFTKHEKDLIIELHSKLGNKWSTIAAKLPGRTDNDIKNFWHAHIQKRRKQNQASTANNKGHATEKASSIADEYLELEAEKPSEIALCSTISYEESANFGDNNLLKLEEFTLSSDTMTKLQQVDFWADPFQVDLAYGQTDYFQAALSEHEFFYSEYCYMEQSSSDNSCQSNVDWTADDHIHNISSSDYVAHEPAYANLWWDSLMSDISDSSWY